MKEINFSVMLETCRPLGIVTIKRMHGYTEKGAGALGSKSMDFSGAFMLNHQVQRI